MKKVELRLVVRVCDHAKKGMRPEPVCRSRYHYFNIFFVSTLLSENRGKYKVKKKERKKKEKSTS
jgi:hypothetical protein